ncbi:MAG: TetR/AcrR family transcriptional regulator [Oceanisphaera sp.]|uniref:TetR/AcrR family transcriptional regulator n=1 Tax=Oceanisphaera sp. TaxID=1929979 RepID=UPI003F9E5ABF
MSIKEHILDVAESLFNELGYTAVGVDLIRDQAKVSKTSMYRHFGSKNKLIEAVLARRHQYFEAQLTPIFASTASVDARLDALIDWHFAWFRSKNFKGCMFMHALAEFKSQDETLAQQALQHKTWLKLLLLSLFDPTDLKREDKAEAIITFLEGMIVRAEFGGVIENKDTYRLSVKTLTQ